MSNTIYYNLTMDGNYTTAFNRVFGDLMTIGGINWFWGIMIVTTMIVIFNKTDSLATTGIMGMFMLGMAVTYHLIPFEVGRLIVLVFSLGLVIAAWKLFKG